MFKNIIRIHFFITIVGIISYENQPVGSDSIVDNRHSLSSSYRDKLIGCLYEDVCSEGEICFDDNAFGRCETYDQKTGSITSDYVYQLDRKTEQLLEQEINRLSLNGFDWIHPYTQCVLKVILNDRPRVVYDPSRCDKLLIPYILTKPSMVKPALINDNWPTDNNNDDDNEKDNNNSIEKIYLQPSIKIDGSKFNLARKNLEKYHKNNINKESLPFISTLSAPGSDQTSISKAKTEKDTMKTGDNSKSIFADKQYNLVAKQRNPTIKVKENDDNYPSNEYRKKSSINNDRKWQTKKNEQDTEDNDDFNAEHNKNLINYLKLMIDNNNEENSQNDDPDWLNSFINGYRELFDVPSNDNSMEEYYSIHSNRYGGNQKPTFFKMPEVRVIRDTESEDEDDDDRIDLAGIDLPTNDNVLWFDLDNEPDDNNQDDLDYRTYADDVLNNLFNDKLIDNIEPFISEGANEDDDKENEENFDPDQTDEKTVNFEKEILLDPVNYDNYLLPNFNRNQRYDIKKPGPIYMEDYFFKSTKNGKSTKSNQSKYTIDSSNKVNSNRNKNLQTMKKDFSPKANQPVAEGPVKLDVKTKNTLIIRTANNGERTNLEAIDSSHTYVITDKMLGEEESEKFLQTIEQVFNLPRGTFSNLRKDNYQITFKVNPNYLELNASQVASRIEDSAELIKEITGFTVKETGIGDKTKLPIVSPLIMKRSNERLIRITFLVCIVIISIISAAFTIFIFHRNGKFREKIKGFMKMSEEWIRFDYQDLCRQKFKSKANFNDNGKEEKTDLMAAEKEISIAAARQEYAGKTTEKSTSAAGNDGQGTPPSRGSSTSSWIEEPIASNMDITTGHIILSYMEDHLKNKNRLDKEWEALCAYEADPCSTNAASQKQNQNKNRYPTLVPYDHSRVILNDFANITNSDYINANTISDHDPRNPAYIATQGPLPNTKADFWQMIWEQGSVLIIMLTRLRENGLNMCERYWPEEGSEMFQNYEVHLVSEHIWCDDYLVRSFYLKNLKTGETRTVTQFHFLSWPENGVPANIKSILDFRRKVNKSYKGRACPMVVHCSDGVGRTGTYILIDMVLNRLAKGAKEIDIAASLEHIRDQRSGMVNTKAQFEFVLLSVADEVQSILKALSQ